MKLKNILENIRYSAEVINGEAEISDIIYDSRKALPGGLFVCISGEAVDGHKFARKAYDAGVRHFVVEHDVELPDDAVLIKVADSRIALSALSDNFFRHPSREIKIVGVTGTKGKSTIVCLVKGVLDKANISAGVIGTNGIEYLDVKKKTVNTTPESYELHKNFREMADRGVKVAVMEVSSQGIKMHRTDHVNFSIGVFTNLSPDHIGPHEHASMDEYISCKAMLFTLCETGIINIDDSYADRILSTATCKRITFGQKNKADLIASNTRLWQSDSMLGVEFDCDDRDEKYPVRICQPGKFSVYNALAVIAVCDALGVSRERIRFGLETTTVKGRAQLVPLMSDVKFVIDYAHNGLSLENILLSLKEYHPIRTICIVGSVGGRTELRRKDLGEIASKYCDFVILTSDNPDFEDPEDIMDEMAKAFVTDCPYVKIADRAEAIRYAVKTAKSGDLILLAGKGHEDYQLIKGERVPFSEYDILCQSVKERKND